LPGYVACTFTIPETLSASFSNALNLPGSADFNCSQFAGLGCGLLANGFRFYKFLSIVLVTKKMNGEATKWIFNTLITYGFPTRNF